MIMLIAPIATNIALVENINRYSSTEEIRSRPSKYIIHTKYSNANLGLEKDSLDRELRIRGGGIIPVSRVEPMFSLPGKIMYFDTIRTSYGLRFLFVGSNFVAINGTDYIWYSRYNITGYDVGDLDMDGVDEVVVLTADGYLTTLDDTLSIVWRRWLGGFAGLVDRVFIGNFSSPNYNMILTYKYGGNLTVYWNCTGDYVFHTEVSTIRLGEIYYIPNKWNYIYSSWDENLGKFIPFRKDTGYIEIYGASRGFVHGNNLYVIYSGFTRIFVYGYEGVIRSIQVPELNNDIGILGKKLVGYDIDGDGDLDFLINNGTHMFLIMDDGDDVATAVFKYLPQPDDYSMIPGYVVYTENNMIYFLLSPTLESAGAKQTYEARNLTNPINDVVYCYGPRELLRILNPVNTDHLKYSFGWEYSQKDTHIVFYNLFSVMEVYPRNIRTYSFSEGIAKVFAIKDGFVVFFEGGGGEVYIFGARITFSTDFTSILDQIEFVDYNINSGELYIALSNTTLITFDVFNDLIDSLWTPPLLGTSKILVGLYYRGYTYYALVNYTSTEASMVIFRGQTAWLIERSGVMYAVDFALGSLCVWDYDGDDNYEVAYAFYHHSKETEFPLNVWNDTYVYVVYDGGEVFRYSGVVTQYDKADTYIEQKHVYSARPFNNSFAFMHFDGKFIIYYSYGLTEEVVLNGSVVWASNGVLATSKQVKIYDIRGSDTIDFENTIVCVASYEDWTYSVCTTGGYFLWNITGHQDVQDPYVSITHPYEGEVINNYTITVSWEVSDDTEISSVFLRLDNGAWIDVTGLSSYTLYGVNEGNHTIYINATDIAERSTIANRSFTVVAPFTLSVYCEDNNSLINRNWVIIEYNTSGTVDSISIYVNGSEWFSTTTILNGSINITGLSSGFWTIDVVAYGGGANISRSITVAVDIDPPLLSIVSPANNTVFATNTSILALHIELSCSDNFGISRIEYNLNNSGWVSIGNDTEINIVIYTDGVYILRLRAYDHAGNTNETALVFYVNFPASFKVSYAYNNTWTNNSTVVFSWESTNIHKVYLYLNGELKDVLEASGTYTMSLDEGIWNITLVAVGYMDTIVRTLWAKIDLTAPTISVLSPKNGTVFNATNEYAEVEIVVSVYDNVGVSSLYLTYDNRTMLISETTTLILGVGNYTIIITAIDEAGNEGKATLNIVVKGEETTGEEAGEETTPGGVSGEQGLPVDILLLIGVVAVAVVGGKKALEKIRRR